MGSAWPWLAVAGVGALHGLNPATGWVFAAARGVRSRDRAQALRALVPIAVGHVASVALVAAAVVLGLALDRVVLQAIAAGLLAVVAIVHLRDRRATARRFAPARHALLALWSFVVSTAHGAGLMLVPALLPLCLGNASAREVTAPGSLALALAALAVHTASMLAVVGIVAAGACRCVDAGFGWLERLQRQHARSSSAPSGERDHSRRLPAAATASKRSNSASAPTPSSTQASDRSPERGNAARLELPHQCGGSFLSRTMRPRETSM